MELLFGEQEAIAPDVGRLECRVNVAGVVMLAVPDQPQEIANHELGAAPIACGLHSRFHHIEAGAEIKPVDAVSGDPVTNRLVEQILAGELARVRRGVGVLVVRHDNDERKFFDGGGVQSFVEGPGRCPAIPDACRPDDAGLALQAAREQSAGHGGNHGSEMRDHGVVALARTAAVDVSIPPAHRPEMGTEVGAKSVENSVAEGHASGLVADQRGEEVAPAQLDADRYAQCLLSAAEEHTALDQSRAVEAGEFLFEHPGEQHDPVGLDELALTDTGVAMGC